METVKVKVEFLGLIARKVNQKEMEIVVSRNPSAAVAKIEEIIRGRAGERLLFNILINGISYMVLEQTEGLAVNEGDIFQVVPSVLAG